MMITMTIDVFAVRVQQGPLPRGVHPHRVRDLRGHHRGGQPGGGAGSLGHSWPGGL